MVIVFSEPSFGRETYDLVILSGRVMDPETEYHAVANVGIKDGKISAITKEKISSKETIDATDHMVAPDRCIEDGLRHRLQKLKWRDSIDFSSHI